MTTFAVGESFSSYEELQKKVDAYQKKWKCVQLTHRDSRAIEAASNRGSKAGGNRYSVHLACVFGGKKYTDRAETVIVCSLPLAKNALH